MKERFWLRMFSGITALDAYECVFVTLEREAYTPYESMSALLKWSRGELSADRAVTSVQLYEDNRKIFEGLLDNLEIYRRNGEEYVRVQSRSFTSSLVQNDLPGGLHANMTLEKLMTGFCTLPGVSYQPYTGTGYIFVKEGTSLWDCIVHFGYKLTGCHPYVRQNTVWLTPQASLSIGLNPGSLLAMGTGQDLTRLVCKFHMEDLNGDPEGYTLSDERAAAAKLERHKYIALDRQYLNEPLKALEFRRNFARRGAGYRYVEYSGFNNECINDQVHCGDFIPPYSRIARMKMIWNGRGLRTKIWVYEDGFYHIGDGNE